MKTKDGVEFVRGMTVYAIGDTKNVYPLHSNRMMHQEREHGKVAWLEYGQGSPLWPINELYADAQNAHAEVVKLLRADIQAIAVKMKAYEPPTHVYVLTEQERRTVHEALERAAEDSIIGKQSYKYLAFEFGEP